MSVIRRDPDRLYKLLPALHRIADSDNGEPLRALLGAISAQADALYAETQQLWDDFFIETCQRWVIPYIGALVGNVPLHDVDLAPAAATAQTLFENTLAGPNFTAPGAIRLRADVAKTIDYRRRKGTPAMLEELARDVTGWDVHVVEFFTRLDWSQHLEHLRLDAHECPDLRRVDTCQRIGGAWDITTRTVDVRPISQWEGWHNLPNIGFFIWRLRAWPLDHVTPRAIGATSWRLTFSPLGQDTPLFASGQVKPGASGVVGEISVQAPIRSGAFFREPPSANALVPAPSEAYYGDGSTASLVVYSDGKSVAVSEIRCSNLEEWSSFTQPVDLTDKTLLIDVTRGRLVVPAGRAGEKITVRYHYGFSAPMAGGSYDRRKWVVDRPAKDIKASDTLSVITNRDVNVLYHVFTIVDNETYQLPAEIHLLKGEVLTIQARSGFRPHLVAMDGTLEITTGGAGASLILSGLLLEGGIEVSGDLDALRIVHCTLVPDRSLCQEAAPGAPSGPSIVVHGSDRRGTINAGLEIQIAFSIVGSLQIPAHIARLWLLDSIVVGYRKALVGGVLHDDGELLAAVSDEPGTSGPPAHIERCTLFGPSTFLKLILASESIFTGPVTVGQRQAGCVRFSWLPLDSSTPQQYRCQPRLEIARQLEATRVLAAKAGTVLAPGWEDELASGVAAWLVPAFSSHLYGHPDFAQLHSTCPVQVRTGAEDGSEMGVFCLLKQPQRESNLRLRLDEYLPVGLEAGILYVT